MLAAAGRVTALQASGKLSVQVKKLGGCIGAFEAAYVLPAGVDALLTAIGTTKELLQGMGHGPGIVGVDI